MIAGLAHIVSRVVLACRVLYAAAMRDELVVFSLLVFSRARRVPAPILSRATLHRALALAQADAAR
jgi:hypothetical protein